MCYSVAQCCQINLSDTDGSESGEERVKELAREPLGLVGTVLCPSLWTAINRTIAAIAVRLPQLAGKKKKLAKQKRSPRIQPSTLAECPIRSKPNLLHFELF